MSKYVLYYMYGVIGTLPSKLGQNVMWKTDCFKKELTLFRLGFFGQSVTGGRGGGSSDPPPPLCISGTNNARVMKYTQNDNLNTKKPHTQF